MRMDESSSANNQITSDALQHGSDETLTYFIQPDGVCCGEIVFYLCICASYMFHLNY